MESNAIYVDEEKERTYVNEDFSENDMLLNVTQDVHLSPTSNDDGDLSLIHI